MFRLITTTAIAAILAMAAGAQAAVMTVLADDLADVVKDNTAKTATIGGWDTVAGIVAPSTVLTFQDGDSATILGFHNVTAGEIDVNNNMTAGGWDTSITVDLDGATSSIALTSLVLNMRLTNGSGANNSTSSKSGQMIAVLTGSTSGLLGQADLGGNIGYPSVEYTRTLDLSGLPTLDGSETYTLTIQARGTGHGHHKSLQALELIGDITEAGGNSIPEPASLAMGLVGLGLVAARRRR